MKNSAISKILSMKIIAVVGMSPNPERPSHFVSKYMINNGFNIIPVNPGQKEILGLRCYPALKDIKYEVDIVNVFRNSDYATPIIQEAISIKAKAIWLQDGIVSSEGKQMAKDNNITYIENDCILRIHKRLYE
ncbi:CoA-binding protein [Candidatus Marinimicrobia bacterium]|nr:CoA-binding protein [Candidatus Neomarinimicrobiota bacterium]